MVNELENRWVLLTVRTRKWQLVKGAVWLLAWGGHEIKAVTPLRSSKPVRISTDAANAIVERIIDCCYYVQLWDLCLVQGKWKFQLTAMHGIEEKLWLLLEKPWKAICFRWKRLQRYRWWAVLQANSPEANYHSISESEGEQEQEHFCIPKIGNCCRTHKTSNEKV